MSALLLLLLLADLQPPPLGRFARPGVPVLLASDRPQPVEIDGWRFLVDGVTAVHPPRIPCVVRDAQGKELLRLEAVPEGVRLVGVDGDRKVEGAQVVRIDLKRVRPEHWRALEVFDEVCGAEPPPKAPRLGNVRPDLYDLVKEPGGRSKALLAARWVVVGAAIALAAQILLLRGRARFRGLAVVVAAATLIGLLRTRTDYTPVAGGRIEIRYVDGDRVRTRTYTFFTAVGPDARLPPVGAKTPILYSASSPVWGEALEDGVIRVVMDESVGPGKPSTGSGTDAPLLLDPPDWPWRASGSGPDAAAPEADPDGVALLAWVEYVRRD